MKTALRFLLCSVIISQLAINDCKAQWVNIPDAGFVAFLNQWYPGCMNGSLMDTSCAAIVNDTFLSFNPTIITNLEGIQYFDNLQNLSCGGIQLNVIPALPKRLKELYCDGNVLDILPSLPPGLIFLSCDNNLLTYLPVLPDSLLVLSCTGNQFSTLPTLPLGLNHLVCNVNQLNSLPALPDGLAFLECSNNQLHSLPALPSRLTQLDCRNNYLSSLPPLPDSLFSLQCNINQLNSLPPLPASLSLLNCSNNNLTSIPELPDSLYQCYVYTNPITCLPKLKRIHSLDFNNTNVTCLPNSGVVTYSNPPLSTLPICDIYNQNDCPVLWNISGKAYFDANGSCAQDSAEHVMVNIPMVLYSSGIPVQQTHTADWEGYEFDTDTTGIYTIGVETSRIPFTIGCASGGLDTAIITMADSLLYDKNLGLACKPGFDLAAWSIYGVPFRPGNPTTVSIHVGGTSNFYGINCSGGISGSVTVEITGPATYVSPAAGALTPDNVNGNVLTYTVADFGNVDFNSSFKIIVRTDTTAALGSTICFTVTVSPITGDDIPANNIKTHCFVVVGSYDPNDKQVSPVANIDTAQEWLTYTIRFQNTGTAEAQHIFITDTLDSDIEVSSFQLLAYSHQPLVELKEDAIKFHFPNINLPDSNTNEPASHGYVQYTVKLKENLSIGTQINNTAFIYFDFNAPVITNTATNTIGTVTAVSTIRNPQSEFRIHPNPANDIVTISIDEDMIGSTATISDITGREMAAVQLQTTNHKLQTLNFASGVYFITVANKEGGGITKKLLVAR